MSGLGDEPGAIDPEAAVRLRGDPPSVMRLSRKAIALASAGALALIGGALIYALRPTEHKDAAELYNTDAVNVADGIASAPKDYGEVPKLGPPLPGDLGRPILAAGDKGAVAALPPATQTTAQVDPARQRLGQERDAARASRVFFGGGSGGMSGGMPTGTVGGMQAWPALQAAATQSATPSPASDAARKVGFLERPADKRVVSNERLMDPVSADMVQAGSVIAAALVTGIRSDLPGMVTAQVTQNVYDSLTGQHLLIPQGSRLIGDYDADVIAGQSRVLLAWNRLILPDGRSIVLERQPAGDASGYAGLSDRVNYHWGGVLKATLISTVLGIGAEAGSGNDSALVRALRQGGQDSVNRAGEQVVSRELGVKPAITVRPGYPVRVLVTRDLVLNGNGEGR